jgi:pyrroloquinoline quinone biosynthesis protein B
VRVRVLGSAAGGGFPQWNCNCANCRGVRTATIRATARTQCSLAVSADGVRWCLINASPDLRVQLSAHPPLWPREAPRGTALAAVLLTDGGIDHVAGLLSLREGAGLPLMCTARVRDWVFADAMFAMLLRAETLVWRDVPSAELRPLVAADGSDIGLAFTAFAVPGRSPRYSGAPATTEGAVIGYRIVDRRRGTALCCMPVVAALDDTVRAQAHACDCLVFDGTFWSEDELPHAGIGTRAATDMGHVPIGGDDGSLAQLHGRAAARRLYTHLNNTNPVLDEDSIQRRAVEAAGWDIATDGMEFEV